MAVSPRFLGQQIWSGALQSPHFRILNGTFRRNLCNRIACKNAQPQYSRFSTHFASKTATASLLRLGVPQQGLLRLTQQTQHATQSRFFQLSAPSNLAFPPLIAALVRLVGKPAAVIVGRYARQKWAELPKEHRENILRRNKNKIGIAAASLALLGFVYYEMHIQEAPFTKRRRFIVFTPEQFKEIADQQRNMLFESMKDKLLPVKHPAYAQVNRVAMRLIRANGDVPIIKNQQWSVTLIGDKEKNAFVLPTGHIFVFLGMLEMVANDDQLGVVLGHEMAHTVLGHGMEQVSVLHFIDYVVMILMSVMWAVLPTDVISGITTYLVNKAVEVLLHLPYGRLLETEADEVGLMLSAKACFDVRESVAFWQRMNIVSEFEGDISAQVPEFLSTHPTHEKRAKQLEVSVPKALELRNQCNCPPLPVRNPSMDVARIRAALSQAESVEDPWKPFIVVIK